MQCTCTFPWHTEDECAKDVPETLNGARQYSSPAAQKWISVPFGA